MKKILRYSYCLSRWIAGKKKDKIVGGTSFLFLNQISFLFVSFFLITFKILPFTVPPILETVIVMLVVSFLMYGLQAKVQALVLEYKFDKEYDAMSSTEIYMNRFIAILLFFSPYILCFIVGMIFYN